MVQDSLLPIHCKLKLFIASELKKENVRICACISLQIYKTYYITNATELLRVFVSRNVHVFNLKSSNVHETCWS